MAEPHIFISYSRVDRPFVNDLVPLLRRFCGSGNVWFDDELLGLGGQAWWQVICDEIARCDIFLYLMSERSVGSPYCRAEYLEAHRLRKKIIPVLIRARTDIPADLKGIQYVDLSAGVKDAEDITNLLTSINHTAKNLPKGRLRPRSPQQTPLPDVPSETAETSGPPRPVTTALPAPPDDTLERPQVLAPVLSRRRLWALSAVAVLIVAFALLLVALNSLINPPAATPTVTVSTTETPASTQEVVAAATSTDMPTSTTAPTIEPTQLPTATSTATDPPTATVTATPETPTSTDGPVLSPEANLALYAEPNSLTLYVASTEPISLVGFQFGVVDDNETLVTYSIEQGFDVLSLTQGTAQPGDCFIYAVDQSSIPPQSCAEIYRRQVALADGFWYDSVRNRLRDIAIYRDGNPTGQICSAASPACNISYATSTPNAAAAPTLTEGERAFQLAEQGVEANDDWTPYIETFGGVEMVLVPAGCFMMGSEDGSSDELPVHEICFDAPFWIDRTGVTNGQYGSVGQFSGENRPRERVTWFEARDFCESRGARLPTEAEWEYAARGPDALAYPWGNEFVAENAVHGGNSSNQTADVGSRAGGISWVGALDLSGNVWEWVSSLYRPYPYDSEDGREAENDDANSRVVRGGSWYNYDEGLRAAYRYWVSPSSLSIYLGFRCARSQ